jgi:hypothetical protein
LIQSSASNAYFAVGSYSFPILFTFYLLSVLTARIELVILSLKKVPSVLRKILPSRKNSLPNCGKNSLPPTYYYTSGYPFLVSRLCKTIDETPLEWSPHGVDDAETKLLGADNTLFDDLIKNVLNNEPLRILLESILFRGDDVGYEKGNPAIALGVMYSIFRNEDGKAVISNIIFETRITNLLISLSETRAIGKYYAQDGVFVKNGVLDMDAVSNRFKQFMNSEYRDEDGDFIESHARLLFLSFLKPIITMYVQRSFAFMTTVNSFFAMPISIPAFQKNRALLRRLDFVSPRAKQIKRFKISDSAIKQDAPHRSRR